MGKFEDSLQPGGAHHFLARLAGEWAGLSRLWFESDKLADESPVAGSIRLVLGGRFALHEYENTIDQRRVEGIALLGYDLAEQRYVCSWADSFHNGTAIMHSAGVADGAASGCNVLGSYPDGQGGPRWGWRTTLELPEPERLLLRHYNITPQGEEALAVEFDYRRA